jgi:SP family arabinose:H+ symporter-like MFS transporter
MPAGFVIPQSGAGAVPGERSSGSLLYLCVLCFVAGLGGLLFGFDTAVISGTIVFLKHQFQLLPSMEGFIVSSGLVGCIAGSLGSGVLSDRFGRRRVLVLSGFLFLACSVGCMVAAGVPGIIVSRLVGGLGVGLASMASPLYISEITPPAVRGRMVSCYQFSVALGVLAAYCSNALLLHGAEALAPAGLHGFLRTVLVDEVWRAMFGAMALPATLFLGLMLLVPESPRWLVKRGQLDRAERTLARISGPETARREMADIGRAVALEEASFRQLFEPGLRRALLIGFLLPIFSQVSGVNIIIYYATSIFEKVGVGRGSSLGMQAIIGLVCVVFTLAAMWKVDRFGRRPLLLFGTTMITATLVMLDLTVHEGAGGGAFLFFLFCWYVATFSATIAPVMWVVISEIFPTSVRGRAMSVGTTSMWVSCCLVAQTYPWLRDMAGVSRTFLIYAVLTAPAVPFVWKLLPETKGRTLEQIEGLWRAAPRP